eukprot:scaffold57_cov254-Pinguiococcus_pyrenoidosus.AAC.22
MAPYLGKIRKKLKSSRYIGLHSERTNGMGAPCPLHLHATGEFQALQSREQKSREEIQSSCTRRRPAVTSAHTRRPQFSTFNGSCHSAAGSPAGLSAGRAARGGDPGGRVRDELLAAGGHECLRQRGRCDARREVGGLARGARSGDGRRDETRGTAVRAAQVPRPPLRRQSHPLREGSAASRRPRQRHERHSGRRQDHASHLVLGRHREWGWFHHCARSGVRGRAGGSHHASPLPGAAGAGAGRQGGDRGAGQLRRRSDDGGVPERAVARAGPGHLG